MHPDTAMSLFNLGVLLDVPDTRAEARQYYEEALSIYEGLDSTSIDTADTLCNLSEALIEEGESSIALRYLERARDIYAARLGRDHSDTRELAKEATALRRKLGVRKKR
jgi:tetratricopeptide (TPR) repeat protein